MNSLDAFRNARSQSVRLKLWTSGAFAVSARHETDRCGALVEYDGANTLRIVGVDIESLHETVITRCMGGSGAILKKSHLSVSADGSVEWQWQLRRPGFSRREVWTAPVAARGHWHQVDRRLADTTRFEQLRDGTIRGTTTDNAGNLKWTSEWTVGDGGSGLMGTFFSVDGAPVGKAEMSGDADSGAALTWDDPESSGSVSVQSNQKDAGGAGSPAVHTVTTGSDGGTRDSYKWDDGDGHSHEVYTTTGGSSPASSGIIISVPGPNGSTSSVNFSTEVAPNGVESTVTINTQQNLDGSSSFSRTATSSDGSTETVFGGTDTDGNSSYSEAISNADGTTTIVTRTTDSDGNGTEHTSVVDADGNVISDQTVDVGPASGGSSGGSNSSGAGGSSGDTQPSDSTPTTLDSPDQPITPDTPTSASDTGDGPDDGDGNGAPRGPLGKVGTVGASTLGSVIANARGGNDGAPVGPTPGDNFAGWSGLLVQDVDDGGSGEGDDFGREGGTGHLIVDVNLPVTAGSDGDWGDLKNPRALTGFAASLAGAMRGSASLGNLFGMTQNEVA